MRHCSSPATSPRTSLAHCCQWTAVCTCGSSDHPGPSGRDEDGERINGDVHHPRRCRAGLRGPRRRRVPAGHAARLGPDPGHVPPSARRSCSRVAASSRSTCVVTAGPAKPHFGYRIARFSRDVYELLDHLGVERFDVLGWSMGVSVWWSFIDQYGTDRIRRFVAVDQPSAVAAVPWMTRGAAGGERRDLRRRRAGHASVRACTDPAGPRFATASCAACSAGRPIRRSCPSCWRSWTRSRPTSACRCCSTTARRTGGTSCRASTCRRS